MSHCYTGLRLSPQKQPELTPGQRAAREAADIDQGWQNLLAMIASQRNYLESLLWENPNGVDSGKIVAALGEQAGKVVAARDAVDELLRAVAPGLAEDLIPQPAWARLDVNEDGTAELSEQIEG